jgi:hypothetical protein
MALLHDEFAPGGFGEGVAISETAGRRLRDRFKRCLGRSIGIEKAIGLLIGVGKLGVAEPCERREISYDLQKRTVTLDQ